MIKPDEKYYEELASKAQNFQLDMGTPPWFDLWHTHVDWKGYGNLSTSDRQKHLSALFTIFQHVQNQAEEMLNQYQTWCIYCADSSEDAVYLHTPNPNADNFPYDFDGVDWNVEMPEALQPFVESKAYRIGKTVYGDGSSNYMIVPDWMFK